MEKLRRRPPWFLKGEISETDARWFRDNVVTSIDILDDGFGFYIRKEGSERIEVLGLKLPDIPMCLELRRTPNDRGLIFLSHMVVSILQEQDKWDQADGKDLAEYLRLKEKLGL